MFTVKVKAVENFTPAMEKLRRSGFHDSACQLTSGDDFDNSSVHILATIDDALVGMIRLTMGLPSVLHNWAIGECLLPSGQGIANVTRGIVDEKWRGKSLYKLLMTETMIKAKQLGAHTAIAAVELDFPNRKFLSSLGFNDFGDFVVFNHPPVGDTTCQF